MYTGFRTRDFDALFETQAYINRERYNFSPSHPDDEAVDILKDPSHADDDDDDEEDDIQKEDLVGGIFL